MRASEQALEVWQEAPPPIILWAGVRIFPLDIFPFTPTPFVVIVGEVMSLYNVGSEISPAGPAAIISLF